MLQSGGGRGGEKGGGQSTMPMLKQYSHYATREWVRGCMLRREGGGAARLRLICISVQATLVFLNASPPLSCCHINANAVALHFSPGNPHLPNAAPALSAPRTCS